jgi:hypothetical protein
MGGIHSAQEPMLSSLTRLTGGLASHSLSYSGSVVEGLTTPLQALRLVLMGIFMVLNSMTHQQICRLSKVINRWSYIPSP